MIMRFSGKKNDSYPMLVCYCPCGNIAEILRNICVNMFVAKERKCDD